MKHAMLIAVILALMLCGISQSLEVIATAPQETPQETPIPFMKVQVEIDVYLKELNLYQVLFTGPFEVMYFITDDGMIYGFTSQLEANVYVPNIIGFLKERGKSLENIMIVIHNHLTPHRFSPRDIQSYHYLRNNGFAGKFQLFYPLTGTVITYTGGE